MMKKYEKSIEDSAKDALLLILDEIPFVKVIDIQQSYPVKTFKVDLAVKIKLSDGATFHLIAEIRNSGQPRMAREAVNQLLRYKATLPDAYLVFIAPYISGKTAEICRLENVGYLDLSGNCLLAFDKIFIKKEGVPNKFTEKRDLKSLYSPKAERILRVLLCNHGRKWKIQELADESNVSLGQASNVKRFLYDRELISSERGGFTLKAPKELLTEWADNYDYRKNQIREFYSLKSVAEIESAIAFYCDKNEVDYALTGFSGAARIALAVRYQKAMIYAADLTDVELSELSMKKVSSGGNLLLFTPYDNGIFYGVSRVDDIQIVSEIQLYLDLQGFRGRGEEAAAVLFERILEKSW